MKTVDYSSMIVLYNFAIGVLIMLSSGQVAAFAGKLGGGIARYTKVSVMAFGACVTFVSGTVYILFHLLRLGVD